MSFADAFWVTGVGASEIRRAALATRAPTDVLVRTLYTAVSRGTESQVFLGRIPTSEYLRLRAPHQEGDFPWPVKYGYSNVGRVLEGPADWIGRVVFCLYPHQTQYVVPASDVILVPEAVPPERAVLAANLETALNGIWDAALRVGDRVSVVGAGAVGCLVARLAQRIPGVSVELIDTNPERQAVAAALGVEFRSPEQASSDRDLVFHASGSGEGLQSCLGLVRCEGKIVELSFYGDKLVSLPLGADFHVRRLSLCSSQVGSVSPNARPRFKHRDRLALALSLLNDEALDALFIHECAFRELPQVMARIASGPEAPVCQRVQYSAEN